MSDYNDFEAPSLGRSVHGDVHVTVNVYVVDTSNLSDLVQKGISKALAQDVEVVNMVQSQVFPDEYRGRREARDRRRGWFR